MSEKQTRQQLQQSFKKLSDQYNTLLEKNQNDQIKIRQKEKTFNETIQNLKQQISKQKKQLDILTLEIEKYKNGAISAEKVVSNKDESEELHRKELISLQQELAMQKKQKQKITDLIELNRERIEHLEENARKLIDENITLTEENQKLKKSASGSIDQIEKLKKQLMELQQKEEREKKGSQKQVQKKVALSSSEQQTEGDVRISEKQHKNLIDSFNAQIAGLNSQLQKKQGMNEQFKNRLRQTNEQLKRFMERDRKNNLLLKQKNEELQNLHEQADKSRKTHKIERKKLYTEEACAKCKDWEQENKLLKEMVKSMQTMVRVREMETQRYKNREALNNSKVSEALEKQQGKKSKGQLPPLYKKNR